MRTLYRGLYAIGFVTFGYLLGVSGMLTPGLLKAQVGGANAQNKVVGGPTDETKEKIKSAYLALDLAMAALRQDKLYTSAIIPINSFLVMAGGADALDDLEKGRGVDPETFAALYADLATDEVAENLGRDEQGRVTYNNKVVRMYPISRLKKMFADRDLLAGLEEE